MQKDLLILKMMREKSSQSMRPVINIEISRLHHKIGHEIFQTKSAMILQECGNLKHSHSNGTVNVLNLWKARKRLFPNFDKSDI